MERCSIVLTSTLYLIASIRVRLKLVVCLIKKDLLISIGSSSIHTIIASKLRSITGRLSGCTSISPRETSISSSSVSVTDCGGKAYSSSPSYVTMLFTLEVFPEGSAMTVSPLRTIPDATLPQKPRKSRFGRSTYCTGKRKSVKLWSLSICTVSRKSSKEIPLYHGVRSDLSTTLSPSSAERGIQFTSGIPNGSTNFLYSATISLNRSSEKSTRSILLTASTTCLIPSKDTRNVWRRV